MYSTVFPSQRVHLRAMNCVELAKDLFYKAIMDMGYDELSVAGSQGRVKVIDCLDDNVWLGTLMLAADRTAIFISKLRVFDAVYLASHDTADKIQAVPLEDYSGNELSSSYSQYEVSTDGEHGAAFRYLMVRGGVADSIIVDGDEARLRNLAYGSYRPGEPLDLPTPDQVAIYEFGRIFMEKNAASLQPFWNSTPSPVQDGVTR